MTKRVRIQEPSWANLWLNQSPPRGSGERKRTATKLRHPHPSGKERNVSCSRVRFRRKRTHKFLHNFSDGESVAVVTRSDAFGSETSVKQSEREPARLTRPSAHSISSQAHCRAKRYSPASARHHRRLEDCLLEPRSAKFSHESDERTPLATMSSFAQSSCDPSQVPDLGS